VLAACAAVCVAVIATVMASRGHAEPGGGEGAGRAPEGKHTARVAGRDRCRERAEKRTVWCSRSRVIARPRVGAGQRISSQLASPRTPA